MRKTVFVTGGARSGKSHFALELAQSMGGQVLFVATAEAGDEDMAERIKAHQTSRPAGWRTLEAPVEVGRRIQETSGPVGTVVIDCITLLVSNVLGRLEEDSAARAIEEEVVAEIRALIECMDRLEAHFIVVTNEVGEGIVPMGRTARIYRDLLGRTNQMLAGRADEVYLMVAGLPLRVKPPAGPP